MKVLRVLLAWLGSALIAAACGSLLQTQFNLAAISGLGAPVTAAQRTWISLQDLAGFAPLLGALLCAGFAIAFPVASGLLRRRPRHRRATYALAGAAAMLAIVLIMNAVLPVTAIPATRSAAGLVALVLAGAVGGIVFAALAPPQRNLA